MIYYGEYELFHAFTHLYPRLPQSVDAIDKMTDWFEEQAKQALIKRDMEKSREGEA